MKNKIIFVCHGNICRSPMAEFIMKEIVRRENRTNDFEISSAAVSYEEVGNDIYPPAKKVLQKHHIPFTHHSAHRISLDEMRSADYIVIMDDSNKYLIDNIIQSSVGVGDNAGAIKNKVHMLMSFASDIDALKQKNSVPNVADPWYTGDFQTAYEDIYNGCIGLYKRLTSV